MKFIIYIDIFTVVCCSRFEDCFVGVQVIVLELTFRLNLSM